MEKFAAKPDKRVKKAGGSSLKRNDVIFILCMIAVPMLHFIVFTLYINVDSLLMAFQNVDYTAVTDRLVFVGFDNFRRFFTEWGENDLWSRAVINSLLYFPVTVLVMLPLSVFAGYFLYRKIPLGGFYKVVFFIPNIVSVVVLAIVFRNMFDSSIGPINLFLEKVCHMTRDQIPYWLTDEKYAMNILYLYAIWAGIGYNVVLIFGAITRVPVEVIESARLDGVGMGREIFQIIVPIIWPTVSTMIVFGMTTVFTQYIHPMVLTAGSGKTYTIAYMIITKVNHGQLYYSAALGIMLLIVAVPAVQLTKWVCSKICDTVET